MGPLLAGCALAGQVAPPAGSARLANLGSAPVGESPANGPVAFVPDAAGANDFALNALTLQGLRAEALALGQLPPAVLSSPRAPAGSRLVIGYGAQLEAFEQAAAASPSVQFVLIDAPGSSSVPNLRTVVFDLTDGAHEAGTLAAARTSSRIVAFIAGKEDDPSHRLRDAFSGGASRARVLAGYSGSEDNQNDAKRLAQDLIGQGA
ncbi:MAG: BMP family ABC transporter substrate-binding protein, partial [Chloroflexi bacterium]|nr:BMP family ABC transporter substrate-binding protein [Chloroflexota bacterium]